MNKLFSYLILIHFFIASFILTNKSIAQCPPSDVNLFSQATVNQFILDFPNCDIINGDLIIGYENGIDESDIDDISGLSGILLVSNDLIIRNNPSLLDLTGLHNILSCEKLSIIENSSLKDLQGLDKLQEVEQVFTINKNDSLVNFIGLNSLEVIVSGFEVFDNMLLENFLGLEQLQNINGGFDIYENPALSNIMGIDQLNLIESYLSITNNNILVSLEGINDQLSIIGSLTISNNPLLSTCEVEAICNYLDFSANATIENNNTNCNSVEAVEAACYAIDCSINTSTFIQHTICGLSNGSITISAVTGNGPFEYLWNTGDTTQTIADLDWGNYSLTITDAIACQFINNYSVDSSTILSFLDSVNTAYCGIANGSIFLNQIQGASPFDILWSNGSQGDSIVNLDPGIYYLTITDDTNCQVTDSIEVYSISVPEANISSTEETAADANDGTASVFPADGIPPYTILWNTGDTTLTITDLIPQFYYVSITDATGCQIEASINVTVFSCNSFQVNSILTPSSCFASCDAMIDLQVTGGSSPYQYEWDGLTDTTAILNDLCFGLYFYTVTDATNCQLVGGITSLETNSIIITLSSTSESYLGQNDGMASIDTISGGTAPYTILWSTMDTTQVITGLSPGSYFATVTDANQCQQIDTIAVEAGSCPALIIEDSLIMDDCIGSCVGSIIITDIENGNAPFSYKWDNGNIGNAIDSLCFGSYTVTITGADSCEFIKQYLIEIGTSTITSSIDIYYESSPNAHDAKVEVTIQGGVAPFFFGWNTGDTTLVLDSIGSGIYEFAISDASGCFYTDVVEIPVFDCNLFEITTAFNETGCFGSNDGSAQFLSINNLLSYQSLNWSNGSQDSTLSELTAGLYTLQITLDSTCVLIDSIFINQNEAIIITIEDIVHQTDSTNASIAISATGNEGPLDYQWQGPDEFTASGEQIIDLQIGCYTVIATDSLACFAQLDSICIEDFTTGIRQYLNHWEIEIYPNPVQKWLYFTYNPLSVELDKAEVSILSTAGKKLSSRIGLNTPIDISDLQSGLYYIVITTVEQKAIFKFSKMK